MKTLWVMGKGYNSLVFPRVNIIKTVKDHTGMLDHVSMYRLQGMYTGG